MKTVLIIGLIASDEATHDVSQNMYSKEDMKKSFEKGAVAMGNNTSVVLTEDGFEKLYDKKAVEKIMNEYLQSLKRKQP